jgi:hypothetical protein
MRQEESYMDEFSFFFDSYAIFEIIKGNKNYKKYFNVKIITTKLNIFELYHGFLKDKNEELANISLEKYYPFVIDFDKEIIKEAANFKRKLNKRDLSMADCIGYFLSKRLGVKFLTGDEQFKDIENVEFVK